MLSSDHRIVPPSSLADALRYLLVFAFFMSVAVICFTLIFGDEIMPREVQEDPSFNGRVNVEYDAPSGLTLRG
ncbi:MAG: hypothetical protein AB7P22_10945 [Vicinamibacterales bacterium]